MQKSNQQLKYSSIKNNAFEEWRELFMKVAEYTSDSSAYISTKPASNSSNEVGDMFGDSDSVISNNISNKTSGKTNKYHQKFMEVLIANSKTKNPLQEWQYIGGNTGRHARWYGNLYPDCSLPPSKNVCICSHPIIENCYIQNSDTNLVLVVGSCCIKRFLPLESQGRACPKCKESHRNRNDPWCDNCRGGILTVGHNKGKSYRWILEREPSYGRFILGISSRGELAKLANWLRTNGLTSKKKTSRNTKRVRRKKVIVDPRKQNIRRISPLPIKTQKSFRNRAMDQIQEANNEKLHFGKYKQKTYRWVLNYDPKYCEWVSRVELPGGWMGNFQSWLKLSNRRN